ncbi:MAG: dihydropteroate synthase [Candidatus Omnitrophica bacterium]|nr:dihydropteroate synthase [Candidatus Omnitrophota bacterium]
MKNISGFLRKRVFILDGAIGTELQKKGMPSGVCPEGWCLDNKEIVTSVHRDYVSAGSDVVYTCTFGANKLKLSKYGNFNVRKINKELTQIAKKAVKGKALVAGSIGPSGKFIEPFGPLGFEEAVNIFKDQVKGLLDGGVDLFTIETMMDIQEARAALIAVKELSDKFTIVTMTYEKDGRSLNGVDPATALITLQSLGADAVGCNCSTGPKRMVDFIKMIKPYAKVPLVAKPNAGMPQLVDGKTVFSMNPQEFASYSSAFASCGVNLMGGCCGTTPAHIKALKRKISKFKPIMPLVKSISAVSSARKSVILDVDGPLVMIGECINPTGKKDLADDLRNKRTSIVRRLAKDQENAGAALLDINVGTSGVDEKEMMVNIIKMLSVSCDASLTIDSTKIDAIEAALRIYPGRALINSISAEPAKIKRLLPLAKKYGAMFVLLPLSGKRIPHKFEERKAIIEEVLTKAKEFGFTTDDIIVDGMAMSVSSNPDAAIETLKTISWANKRLKCNTVVGLSNISFGMPQRAQINAEFLAMARASGLTMAIVNPMNERLTLSRLCTDLLMNRDRDAREYISRFTKKESTQKVDLSIEDKVSLAIIEGNRDDIESLVSQALKSSISADRLVKQAMIPAIDKVGDFFDKKQYFLPQLIASAESMKIAFNFLAPHLKKTTSTSKQTVVILATVKDDIHDIGKNIVALMIKNHSFNVVDLGSDVSTEKIITEIKRHKACVVGLSALMTTTMVNMKDVIFAAKNEKLNCRFIVGGAVITKKYAQSLGAEYASDGVDAVRVVKKLTGK